MNALLKGLSNLGCGKPGVTGGNTSRRVGGVTEVVSELKGYLLSFSIELRIFYFGIQSIISKFNDCLSGVFFSSFRMSPRSRVNLPRCALVNLRLFLLPSLSFPVVSRWFGL